MVTTVWILIFIASLLVLVKSADWLLESAERIGLAFGLSPFIVGVLIVGLGTTFPEIVSSFAALIKGVTTLIPANAVGSNITNILLIVGSSAVLGRRLTVTKNLIDLDLPLLAITTSIFVFVAWDGNIYLLESLILVLSYAVYFGYTILYKDDGDVEDYKDVGDILPSREDRREHIVKKGIFSDKYKNVDAKDFIFLFLGIVGLLVGAKYLIDSVIEISLIFNIIPGVIAISAVALGTSLPELLVSTRAAWKKKSEVALGNIFGANVFNVLVVVGLPGLFRTLEVDQQTISIGIPFLITATVLFIFSGISRRIHIWEGLLYIVLYLLFILKLFAVI